MKYAFQPLPAERMPRPVVPLSFPKLHSVQLLGLVDSGAVGTRISDEFAVELGIDLDEIEPRSFAVARQSYHYRSTITELKVGHHAPRPMRIDFVEGWSHDHALLGIKGFFEEFIVRINALQRELSLTPSRHPAWADVDDTTHN